MPVGDTLFQRLGVATRAELDDLLGTLRLDPKAYAGTTDEKLIEVLSKELRSVAGHSARNVFRKAHDLSYKKILIDVADKLAPGMHWSPFKMNGVETEEQIEEWIDKRVSEMMQEHLRSMSDAERVKSQEQLDEELRKRGVHQNVITATIAAVTTGTLTGSLLAPMVASTLFASIWRWLIALTLKQLLIGGLVAGGPVGIGFAALTSLAGTSYSKTIPAVVRLIFIRHCREAEQALEN